MSNLLYGIYNKNTITIVDNTVIYQPLDTLYREYLTIIEHEYNVSAAMLSRAIENVNNAISDCYELSHKVVVYLLHDMKNENLTQSEFTKEHSIQLAEQAEKDATVAYFTKNRDMAIAFTELLHAVKSEITGDDGTVAWDSLYEKVIEECTTGMMTKGHDEALQYSYYYTVATNMQDMLKAIDSEGKYNECVGTLTTYSNDTNVVIAFYRDEVLQCKNEEERQALLETYVQMLENKEDEHGNALSEEELAIIQVKITALTQPDVFDLLQPCDYTDRTNVMDGYAHYVITFYDESLEKQERIREEGFIGTIARIFGITDGEADEVFKRSMTVADLVNYGKKAENYVNGKEFGTLPGALKEALQAVVSQYHDLLTWKTIYEHRDATAEEAQAAYEQQRELYQKLAELQEKYNELIAIRQTMYSQAENEYTARRESYYALQPYGVWTGFTDAMIQTFNECEMLYNAIKDEIDQTPFAQIQTALLAQLSTIEQVRNEYEYIDYTARYLLEPAIYGSVEEYMQRMLEQGKNAQFVGEVKQRIERELAKQQAIQGIMTNPSVDMDILYTQWEGDNGFILAAYYEGLKASAGDSVHFNAYDYGDFAEYALLYHFQQYVMYALDETDGELPGIEMLLGRSDGEDFIPGSFALLSQYAEHGSDIEALNHELESIYYATVVQKLLPEAFALSNSIDYRANNEQQMIAHFIAYLYSVSGETMPEFAEVYGMQEDDGTFSASGFSALPQYYTDDRWQQWFTDNYTLCAKLYDALKEDSAAISYAYLPDGVREYAIVSDYYLYGRNGKCMTGSAQELLTYYGINSEAEGYDSLKAGVEGFMHIYDVALQWDGNTPIADYMEKHNITDEKEKNFLILYSIDPDLADPVDLIVADSRVPLVLTGYTMQEKTEALFETIADDSEGGLQQLLGLCIYAANRDSVTAQTLYQFILSTRNTFTHYRDYLPILEQYYEKYAQNNNTPGVFYQMIIDKEHLSKRDDIGDIYYQYYQDYNGNEQYENGEKTLKDFIDEYKQKGYTIDSKKKNTTTVDAIQSDDLHGNEKGYYSGDSKSYFNAVAEEATNMAAALDMLVEVARMAIQATDTFVLTDSQGNQRDIAFMNDVDELMGALAATGYTPLLGEENNEEETENDTLQTLFATLKDYDESALDARIDELIEGTKEDAGAMDEALLQAYGQIAKLGGILKNQSLDAYLASDGFLSAQETYATNKQLFEQAQESVQEALNTYHTAQDTYTKQLEIVTLLYNRLEEARKLKEDEEALFTYAQTAYLYNSSTNAEGGDDAISTLQADAREQYQQALAYRNEVKKTIEQLEQQVQQTKAQKVEQDARYRELRDELKERAERAYRMEKTAFCMQNEIKKLGFAYDEAKAKYDAKKEAFLQTKDDDYANQRDRLIDSMIEARFIYSLRSDIKTAAYFYNSHPSWSGRNDKIFKTENWANDIIKNNFVKRVLSLFNINVHYHTSIPGGNELATMQTPLYTYLSMMNNEQVTENQLFRNYFEYYLKAREAENKLDNVMLLYSAIYHEYYPIKKHYDKLYNKKIRVLGKKIHPLRPLAKAYYYASGMPIIEKALDFLFKGKRPALLNEMNRMDANAKYNLNIILTKLTDLQESKIQMLKAKAALARYTEIESLDDAATAGTFVYYNPRTMQMVVVGKPTLKGALREIAQKNGIALTEGDMQFMVTTNSGGDTVNVNNYRQTITTTDEHGYQTNEQMQVLHAGTVSQTYANIMNQQKRECFGRYIAHTQTLYTSGGYDRVVVDRAVEKDLYGIWAGDSSGYQSARVIGAESPGMLRAMVAYMGYTEGIPHEVINQLDAMIGTGNEAAVSELFAQYVKQYEGINDRELAQGRALQVHQWQMTQQQMQDKKADWDRMVKRIFERGIRQWDMMLNGFASRWKNWQEESEESMVKGAKQWDEKMQRLRDEKLQWLADAYSGVSYKELLKRMAGIEVVVTDMLATIKEQYGDAIGKVDVHAILVDIVKDQPQLLSNELMAMTKHEVEFGLTQVSGRSYNRSIFEDAQTLGKEYATVQKKTHNIALLKALTQLLEQCREQIEAANEQAEQAALQFVSAYAFGRDGNRYKRTLPITSTRQTITAYQPFAYTDSLLLGGYSIPVLMDIYNKDDGVQFEATMNVVMAQAQTRMGMMMRPDVVWGFHYYVGQFGQIKAGPKLKEGKGQYGRITKDVYEAEKEKATQDAVCQYVNAGIGVALSFVTANPMVGAAYMSVGQAGDVAAGDLSLQHWAVQTGISMGASYAGGYVGKATHSAVYGSMAASGIQGLGNFVDYKDNGGLGLQWGSTAQWRSFGIGSATALVGAKMGEVYSDAWNNSWQQYGYTASSSFVVNRFDGTGSWKDDMLQAGASVAAMWTSNALLSDGTTIGQSASSHNAVLPMNRFMQGTLENAILAGADMMQGDGMQEALLQQNWEKTQYTAADWLSDWAAQKGRQDAEDWKSSQKKEGILGLAWLGLSRAGSMLSSAWDGVSELFERGKNVILGNGFRTNEQVADVKASQQYWHMVEAIKAKYPTMGEQYIKNTLIAFAVHENGEVGIENRAAHLLGERGEAVTVQMPDNSSKVLGDINWALGKALGISAEEAFNLIKGATGKGYKQLQEELNTGKIAVDELVAQAGGNASRAVLQEFVEAYKKVSDIRANKNGFKVVANDETTVTQQQIQQTGIMAIVQSVYTKVTNYISDLFGKGYVGVTLENGARLPLKKGEDYLITSNYSERTINGKKEFHEGIDIAVPEGTPVLAVEDGVVVHKYKDGDESNYGNSIIVKTKSNLYYLVAHTQNLLVGKDQEVSKGMVIAYSGNSGYSTGPHIHFEIVKGVIGDKWEYYWLRNRIRGTNRIDPLKAKW